MDSYFFSRQSKPRNRPSFRQTLMHLDIASADVLATPQETYFKSQVNLEILLAAELYSYGQLSVCLLIGCIYLKEDDEAETRANGTELVHVGEYEGKEF